MHYTEGLQIALQSLWANKLRSVLTLIGVVMAWPRSSWSSPWSTAPTNNVSTKLSGYGADVFTVSRMSAVIFSAEDYFKGQKRTSSRMGLIILMRMILRF